MKNSRKEKQPVFPVAAVFTAAGFLAACCVAWFAAVTFVTKSDYFKIRDCVVRGPAQGPAEDFSYLKGRNIFSVDLKEESARICAGYPSYKQVRLVRVLPNRLVVDFLRRRPVALLRSYRQFMVDEDGVVFSVPADENIEDVPLITGLEAKMPAPKPGVRYAVKELLFAVTIAKEAKKQKVFAGMPLKRIHVTGENAASLFLLEGLEVKIGRDAIRDKMAILGKLLAQAKNDLGSIQYVDLRFKEPLIKFKEGNR